MSLSFACSRAASADGLSARQARHQGFARRARAGHETFARRLLGRGAFDAMTRRGAARAF